MDALVTELIQQELARRDWRQADLCRVLGWSAQTLSEVMQGKRRLDPSMALDLEYLTGKHAEEWLGMQTAADLGAARRREGTRSRQEDIAIRAEGETLAPVRELVRRKYVTAGEPGAQLAQVRELIGDGPTSGASAKKSVVAAPFTRTQNAWIAIARNKARGREVERYDRSAFQHFASALPHQVLEADNFRSLPLEFARHGVPLVYVKPFPGGRIDGVSLNLDGSPMIALSGRGKRLDKVLFTLLHECAHLVEGDWRQAPRIHERGGDGMAGDDPSEIAASALAESWAFPNGIRANAPISRQSLLSAARDNGVAPALVVGQLQHVGALEWSSVLSRGLPSVEEALMSWT